MFQTQQEDRTKREGGGNRTREREFERGSESEGLKQHHSRQCWGGVTWSVATRMRRNRPGIAR
jgi:pyruvate carboxylase